MAFVSLAVRTNTNGQKYRFVIPTTIGRRDLCVTCRPRIGTDGAATDPSQGLGTSHFIIFGRWYESVRLRSSVPLPSV